MKRTVLYPNAWTYTLPTNKPTCSRESFANLIDADRYFLSPRIRTLREILNKIKPEPEREPLPPIRQYEPPRRGRYAKRR
jgi:hypothetical protein